MKRIVFCLLTLLSLLSCTREQPAQGGLGAFSLAVALPEDPDTKAVLSPEELLSGARVSIYYADFSGLVRSYRCSEMPQAVYLPAGNYRVDVEAGEMVRDHPANPSSEQKSYAGSQEFTITGGQTTQVSVEAGCCNVIARMLFDETLPLRFEEGYSLTLSLGGEPLEGRTVFPAETVALSAADAGRDLFFLTDGREEPALDWKFEGVLKMTGAAFSKEGTVAGVQAGKRYELTLKYIARDGLLDGGFDVSLDYAEEVFDDIVVFEPVATGISPSEDYEIWATRAIVHADVDSGEYDDPSDVKFEYALAGSGNWTRVDAAPDAGGVFRATLAGLTPATKYAYRLLIGDTVVGEPVELTTDVAPNVPNASFEYATNVGKYYEWYNTSASEAAARTAWWGSGNGSKANGIDGSADMGYVICKPDTGDKVDGSQSACLQSTWAVVKFAAGNIFSGYFGGLVGTKGGIVYYGRPFTARPSALKVWLKYSTGNVNRKDGYPSSGEYPKEGQPDWAQVYIALGTWDYRKYGGTRDCPIRINTTDHSTFHDYRTMQGSIAYGNLILKGSNGGWNEYTIPFEYSDLNTIPTHILISCAASMLGDYFTGCDSSKLWVDKMELVYE